ncbi:unnamed protein product, partial [Staurois parvus]
LYLPIVYGSFAQSSLDPPLLGSLQALLALLVCRVPPQQAACYGGTRCSVCPFTHKAMPMRRQRPRAEEAVIHITGSR